MRRIVGIVVLVSVLALAATGTAAARLHRKITVPIAVIHARGEVLAIVRLKINGHKLLFVVDSGAAKTTIDSRYAKALGLPKVGAPTAISGVGGSTKAQAVRITDWSLGGTPLPSDVAASARLGIAGGRIAGLLGSDEMSKFGAVKINYRAHRLTLG